MYRVLTNEELRDLAEHLIGSDDSLVIGLSEMGFDPDLVDKRFVRDRLRSYLGCVQRRGFWVLETN